MIVEVAGEDIIPEWLELAREVEPLFQAAMASDAGFHEFMKRKIEQKEAYSIRDDAKRLLGLIAISHNNNAISWFAVFSKHRKSGVGSSLLGHALQELDNGREITVVTFRKDNEAGIPTRRLYQKFGFIEHDSNVYYDGLPRSLLKKLPDRSA
jgi:ribosomal protein S18 acetylase RimI-like enzyme